MARDGTRNIPSSLVSVARLTFTQINRCMESIYMSCWRSMQAALHLKGGLQYSMMWLLFTNPMKTAKTKKFGRLIQYFASCHTAPETAGRCSL